MARPLDLVAVMASSHVAAADGRPPEPHGDDTAAVLARIGAADAVLLATPVSAYLSKRPRST